MIDGIVIVPPHASSYKYSYLNAAIIRSTLLLLVMFYVPLCHFTLQYFSCKRQPDGRFSLNAEPSLRCWDGRHLDHLGVAITGVIVYILGIPLACIVILYKFKDKVCIDMTMLRHLLGV